MMQYKVWIIDEFYHGWHWEDYIHHKAQELQQFLETKHVEVQTDSGYVAQCTLKEAKFQNSAGETHRVYEITWYYPEYAFYSWENVIKALHLNFHCIVEFMYGAEESSFYSELYREITGPDGKVWFKEKRNPALDEEHPSLEPEDLSSNPSLADVVDEHFEEAVVWCNMKVS